MKQSVSRRNFVGGLLAGAAMALIPGMARAEDIVRFNFLNKKAVRFPYELSDAQWREKLGEEGYRVMRQGENEKADSSPLLRERRKGIYACRGCGQPLFSSNAKMMVNDWPTFRAPLNRRAIATSADYGHILPRTEVHCANCGGHLGYKFNNGDQSAEIWRYAINGASLAFKPAG